jgi:RNA polymerase sigma-70 factor (ECF subfamily)
LNEQDLIAGLKSKDESAAAQLDRLYRRRLMATAAHFLGPADPELEDVVQEALLAAWKGVDRFEGRSSLYTWLNHICVNLCFGRVRSRKRTVSASGEEIEAMLRPHEAAAHRKHEEEAERAERRELLARLMAKLKKECRELLELRLGHELSMNEIKERLRLPLGTVASRLARCQDALKKAASHG